MFKRIIATGSGLLILLSIIAIKLLPPTTCLLLGIALVVLFDRLRRDRWEMIRCHRFAWVRRHIYQSLAIYHLAWRLDNACGKLPPPVDALDVFPGGEAVLESIIASGPDTFQSKPTNRAQIESLMECVCGLVEDVQQTGASPLVLDIGAGKALFTRAVYEALDRHVPVVALDSRRPHKGDEFYDPPPGSSSICSVCNDDDDDDDNAAPYTRLVADVRYLAARTTIPLKKSRDGGVVAITKHLCGGATDGSIVALCAPPLDKFVGACCFAPCCHQKTKRNQYCNIPYLESMGFCRTHIGMRGGVQDNDFRNFGMLISMSRASDLKGFEYKKSTLLQVLGFTRASRLGRKCRRLLEEGRMRYLRDHDFDAYLVKYCDASITGDNFAIIARKKKRSSAEEDEVLCEQNGSVKQKSH